MGLEGEARAVPAIEGLVDLGFRHLGQVLIAVFMASARASAKALSSYLASHASHARAVVLVPRGRTTNAGVLEVAFDPAGPYAATLREVLLFLKLGDEVDAIVIAPPAARFVIDTMRELAWLDGVRLSLGATELALLTALAKAAGAVVGSADLAKAVASGPRDGSMLKKQKLRLVVAMRESFTAAHRKPPGDFDRLILPGARQGYRLAVEAFVR